MWEAMYAMNCQCLSQRIQSQNNLKYASLYGRTHIVILDGVKGELLPICT